MNRLGMKEDLYIFITNKAIYNYDKKKYRASQLIVLHRVNAITISKGGYKKSDEFLIHVRGAKDHRYKAGRLRDTIVDLVRRLV